MREARIGDNGGLSGGPEHRTRARRSRPPRAYVVEEQGAGRRGRRTRGRPALLGAAQARTRATPTRPLKAMVPAMCQPPNLGHGHLAWRRRSSSSMACCLAVFASWSLSLTSAGASGAGGCWERAKALGSLVGSGSRRSAAGTSPAGSGIHRQPTSLLLVFVQRNQPHGVRMQVCRSCGWTAWPANVSEPPRYTCLLLLPAWSPDDAADCETPRVNRR